MKQLSLVLLSTLFSANLSYAADRIGNGGGLWVCADGQKKIQSSELVDLYEARTEYNRTLVTSNQTDPMRIVADVEGMIKQNFPEYANRWSAILADVKTRINYVPSKLSKIEDALYHVEPLESECATKWEYVQFANYTAQNQVLIRKDLWLSSAVSPLDKAGLIWHEVIYRWMREEFDDQDSVRSRQIVGVLFSTLSTLEARGAVAEILKPAVDPKPETPVWVCFTHNSTNHRYFMAYETDELAAKSATLTACQGGGDAFFCDEYGFHCDSFTSMKQPYTCSNTNSTTHIVHTAKGRSMIEAEGKARVECTNGESPFFCEDDVKCN
jgi:hypothetical protein